MAQWNHTRVAANWTGKPNLVRSNLPRWKWNSLTQLICSFLNWDGNLGREKMPRDASARARHRVSTQHDSVSTSSLCTDASVAAEGPTIACVHCCDGSTETKEMLILLHSWESPEWLHSHQRTGSGALGPNEKQTAPSSSAPTNHRQLERSPSRKFYNPQSSITSCGPHLQNQESFKP